MRQLGYLKAIPNCPTTAPSFPSKIPLTSHMLYSKWASLHHHAQWLQEDEYSQQFWEAAPHLQGKKLKKYAIDPWARSAPKAPTRRTMPSHAGQESWYRSHFGSRYKSGPCFTAGLLVRRVDSGWRAFWDHQQQQQQQHCAATETTPRGFEPLRAEPNGFLVHLLDRSDTVSPPF